jgi:hypothetical protein
MNAHRIVRIVELAVAAILGLAAVGKLLALGSSSAFLDKLDPVFKVLGYRQVMWATVITEIVCALLILGSRFVVWKHGIIFGLGACFVAYHLLIAQSGPQPCSCLGSIPASVGMSKTDADRISLLVASFMLLFGTGELVIRRFLPPSEREE